MAAVTRSQDSLANQIIGDGFKVRRPSKPREEVEKARRKVEVICAELRRLIVPWKDVLVNETTLISRLFVDAL